MAKSEPIRSIKEIERIGNYYLDNKQVRNYVLFEMGIYTSLRISDLLLLKWGDVYNYETRKYYEHLYITEKKTKKHKKIALNKNAIKALKLYLDTLDECSADTWLFPNNRNCPKPISRVQAYKIIRNAVADLKIKGNISCHSMRKVIGYHSWKAGVPLALISEIYNHSSERVTKRYLGIRQDEIDAVYLGQNYRKGGAT